MVHELKQFGRVKTNEPLAKYTTFKIGGPADYVVTVEETEKLVGLLQFLVGAGVPYFILGGGSNMLVRDEGFRGAVVKIKNQKSTINNDTVEVDAGCMTVAVAQESIKAGLTGFEWGGGVPGTIGGAVRGNAGAMNGEMKDVVEKIDIYRDGEVITLSNRECRFGYRGSVCKEKADVVLRVWLQLQKTDNMELMKKALEYLQYRNKTQPQGFSTGCIFKNHEIINHTSKIKNLLLPEAFIKNGKIPAGWLVEKAGMKGVSVGGAQVSERHGNFIVNRGNATAQDVLSLIDEIKSTVYDMSEVELEEEIQIV